MSLENESLVLDLLEWIAREPKLYTDVMEAWRTSCPRLSVWEDASDAGLLARQADASGEVLVRLTPTGSALLIEKRGGQPAEANAMAAS